MRQVSFFPQAIFSLNMGTEEQERSVLDLHGFFANKPLVGVHDGQEERVWLVPITQPEHKQLLLKLLTEYKQTSVLFSDIDRTSHLYYIEEQRSEDVGVLQEVSKQYAKSQKAYIYDQASGAYWVAS